MKMDKTWFKLPACSKIRVCRKQCAWKFARSKAIMLSVFLRVLFTSLVSSQGLPPSQFTLTANHNQLGLIEFYENVHLARPLHESKFISKQSSHDRKQSLILRGSQRELPEETNSCLQLHAWLCPPDSLKSQSGY